MLLQSQVSLFPRVLFIHKINDHLIVYLDDHSISNGNDVLGPPGVIFDQLFTDFDEVIQGAGALRIRTGVLYLGLISFGPSPTQLCPEIHTAVAFVIQFHGRPELHVAISVRAEQMTARPLSDQQSFLINTPGVRIERHPAAEALPIHQ